MFVRGRSKNAPTCHLERSPPEIPPSLGSVLLRSSTPLRFAQNDTGGRSRNPKGERQCRSDLAGRLKPALRKSPLWSGFFFGDPSGNLLRLARFPRRKLVCVEGFATFLKKGSAKNFPTGKILGYFSKNFARPLLVLRRLSKGSLREGAGAGRD